MPNKDLDRRIQKTLQLLEGALTELIAEKEYDDITIQQILDRANVGRSTFYAHFENKDQLLRSLLTHLNERFDEGIRQLSEGKTLADNSAHMPFSVLQFVEQNHRLFKAMLRRQGHGTGSNPFAHYLFVLTREHLKLMVQHEEVDARALDLATHYYASGFISALVWWLENDMIYSAEEFAQMLNQLTLPGYHAYLLLPYNGKKETVQR
jgi:AcrR family transcriptional regulator